MLQGRVFNVEERDIVDDKTKTSKKYYKTLIMIEYDNGNVMCEKYLQDKKEAGKCYEVIFDRTDNLKYLNVKLGKEVINSSQKGIFNK